MGLISSPDRSAARAVVLGTFDGVHRGHVALIGELKRYAAGIGAVPSVVTFRENPITILMPDAAPQALMSPRSKAGILLRHVPDVIMFDFDEHLRGLSAGDFLAMLRDDYGVAGFMAGYDTRFGSDLADASHGLLQTAGDLGLDFRVADSYVEVSDPPQRVSSSSIRCYVADGDMESASLMLGYNYAVAGTVEGGSRIGRTIGFPTANVSPEYDVVIPANGVYAAVAHMPDGSRYEAMVNVGMRPTVTSDNVGMARIEAHILDFSGDIYGQRISVEFVRRIRSECKFASLDELRRQLERDESCVRSLLSGINRGGAGR